MDEFSFISKYLSPLSGSGSFGLTDDIALLDTQYNYGFSTDTMVENIHFFPNIKPDDLAFRLISVSISDLICKALTPKFYALNLTFSKHIEEKWLDNFSLGLKKAQKYYDISLLGGDTTITDKNMVLTATIFGAKTEKVILRSNAKINDDIWVTGNIGDAFLGLEIASKKLLLDNEYLLAKYNHPTCHQNLQKFLLEFANSALDISDGLIQDLEQLCSASNCGALVNYDLIPLSKIAQKILKKNPKYKEKIINSGDDYEILFTANPRNKEDIIKFSKETKTKISYIGKIKAENSVDILDINNQPISVKNLGYKHSF